MLYWHSQTEMMFFVPFPDVLCRHFAKPGQTLAEAVGEHKLQPFQEEIHVGEHFFSRQVLLRGLGFGIPALLRPVLRHGWDSMAVRTSARGDTEFFHWHFGIQVLWVGL